MKYRLLNLVSALAVLATSVADRLTVLAARSATSANRTAVNADKAALDLGVQIVQKEKDKAMKAQVDAYSAYQRCRGNFQDKSWEAIEKLASLKAKHALAAKLESSC